MLFASFLHIVLKINVLLKKTSIRYKHIEFKTSGLTDIVLINRYDICRFITFLENSY